MREQTREVALQGTETLCFFKRTFVHVELAVQLNLQAVAML